MRPIREILKSSMTAKVGLAAGAVVVAGAGAAIAVPGLVDLRGEADPDVTQAADDAEPLTQDELLQLIADFCEEDPSAPFCTGPSDPDDAVDPDG